MIKSTIKTTRDIIRLNEKEFSFYLFSTIKILLGYIRYKVFL